MTKWIYDNGTVPRVFYHVSKCAGGHNGGIEVRDGITVLKANANSLLFHGKSWY